LTSNARRKKGRILMTRNEMKKYDTTIKKLAQKQDFCFHVYATKMKERKEDIRTKKARVNGQEHCIHCDEDPMTQSNRTMMSTRKILWCIVNPL
jgi:hypothetical protein